MRVFFHSFPLLYITNLSTEIHQDSLQESTQRIPHLLVSTEMLCHNFVNCNFDSRGQE